MAIDMRHVAPFPQVRTAAGPRARSSIARRFGAAALLLMPGCFTGLPGKGGDVPWETNGATDSGDDDGGNGDDDDDDGADGDDDGGTTDGGGDDDSNPSTMTTASDDGTDDAADDAGDAGTDGGVDDGADSAADAGTDDGGTEDEVPAVPFCTEVSGVDPSWSQLEDEILEIVNQRRAEGANCGSAGSFGPAGPLTMNPALRCAARVHSKQMVEENFFDHTTPWGESPWDRMAAAGYSYSSAGENIAAGNATAASTMQQWMDSDGHCSNIMSPDFTEIGVGYFPGGGYGHYWTQAFGRP
jgi:uncharacterized protein YkwD